MSERIVDLQRELASCLEPVRAPESLWYRVDAELRAPSPARGLSLSRLAVVFGLLLASAASLGWYFDRPGQRPGAERPQGSRQHACVVCHG